VPDAANPRLASENGTAPKPSATTTVATSPTASQCDSAKSERASQWSRLYDSRAGAVSWLTFAGARAASSSSSTRSDESVAVNQESFNEVRWVRLSRNRSAIAKVRAPFDASAVTRSAGMSRVLKKVVFSVRSSEATIRRSVGLKVFAYSSSARERTPCGVSALRASRKNSCVK